ncbi:hypothetical protein D3C86_1903810 [compost metagenome]
MDVEANQPDSQVHHGLELGLVAARLIHEALGMPGNAPDQIRRARRMVGRAVGGKRPDAPGEGVVDEHAEHAERAEAEAACNHAGPEAGSGGSAGLVADERVHDLEHTAFPGLAQGGASKGYHGG